MNIYVKILLTAWLVVFVVDLSGFTQTWKATLGRWLHVEPGNLRCKPFDCSLCMTWWVTLLVVILAGRLSFVTVGFCALCALFSDVLATTTTFVKDAILGALDAFYKLLQK